MPWTPYLYNEIREIETGEQSISFFAKHGFNTPVKFMNCNRARVRPDEFRPYDLVVVQDEKELDQEYFTISAQGVVHVCPEKGKKYDRHSALVPTEFFNLSDWMHQSTMFNVLTSMKFFKHYLIGKVFNQWKGNVRYRMFCRTRKELAKNLIFTRPDFIGNFTDISTVLLEMQMTKSFQVAKMGRNYEIDEF